MMRSCFLFLAALIIFNSCKLIGINFNESSPRRAKPYPDFTRKDSLRGRLTDVRTCFDVTYYDLNIEVIPKEKYLKGYVDIYFNAKKNIDLLQIDLYENMKINKIEHESSELKYKREFNAVFISFPAAIREGSNQKLRVYYEGKPRVAAKPPWKGGFVWKKHSGNPWIGVACESDGGSLWWPLKDHLSDEPDSAGINITVPEGLSCVSNGVLRNQVKSNGKETFHWFVSTSINTYNITLYIGKFSHFTIPYPGSSSPNALSFYVLPENEAKAKEHFKQVVDIIQFYESVFGEYPWWHDGYKLVESPFAGMEHQTAIAYGNGYKNFPGYPFDHIILHETAHEWWGNSLTAYDFSDVWLHEGFATFSEALYVEHIRGHQAYLNYLGFYKIFIKNKQTVIGPKDVAHFDFHNGDVYVKGAWFLHTLRCTIGNDSLFFDILKTFITRNREKIVSTQDFLTLVNLKTGKDYQWLFKQYLYNRKPPKLQYRFEYYNNEYRLSYQWTDVDKDFILPVEISAGGEKIILHPTTDLQTVGMGMNRGVVFETYQKAYMALEKLK
jgi:aminopeptidase N